jgi:hypothetical protein
MDKNAYFQVVGKDDKLIIVLTGNPTADDMKYVVREFDRFSKNEIATIVCDDRFKFYIVPKDTKIEGMTLKELKKHAK